MRPTTPGDPARYGSGSLLTDLYQLTMAQGYFHSGLAHREAIFHMFFRRTPFGGGYALTAGLEPFVRWLREDFHFDEQALAYLSSLQAKEGRPLFQREFLDYLAGLRLTCDLDAVPEGTVVFPHEPLVRVRGPLVEAQLLETALLTYLNFQTLVATKAARVCYAAQGDPVVEFGLRRAQGPDGGLSASRASYIGGVAGTSNVLAGQVYGIPVKGTHAHSWVMAFGDEREAFSAYAKSMPDNCIFLVDTYDSLDGVRNAVAVGRELRAAGHEMVGIRLDSGDLAYLSREARRILDAEGFPNAKIVASNDIDEHIILSLRRQGARVDVWGIGTRLVTAFEEPALGGVYKLAAVRSAEGEWEERLKVSEQSAKTTIPGNLDILRFSQNGKFIADMIYDSFELDRIELDRVVSPESHARVKSIPADASAESLLVPIFRAGKLLQPMPDLESVRTRASAQLRQLDPGILRFENPHSYPAGLEPGLHERREALRRQAQAARVKVQVKRRNLRGRLLRTTQGNWVLQPASGASLPLTNGDEVLFLSGGRFSHVVHWRNSGEADLAHACPEFTQGCEALVRFVEDARFVPRAAEVSG